MSADPNLPTPSNLESKLPNAGRRQSKRRSIDSVVGIELLPGVVRGTSRDVSEGGMLLFSSDRLPVRVTFEDNGREIELAGHLVRVQRTSREHVAYAIEFDAPLPDSVAADGSTENA